MIQSVVLEGNDIPDLVALLNNWARINNDKKVINSQILECGTKLVVYYEQSDYLCESKSFLGLFKKGN